MGDLAISPDKNRRSRIENRTMQMNSAREAGKREAVAMLRHPFDCIDHLTVSILPQAGIANSNHC
jgi:hypothetical protein